ncbi:MAG TPA: DUF3105 domain-containing protein [Candidatus Limnocylindrales bacterium]|nr:DUF3105 domain-containing protein [Candidatus Limnocylindrales bacterium]
MTDSRKPPQQGGGQPRTTSASPTGTNRAGRRDTARRRAPEQTTLQRLRKPILAIVVIAALAGVGLAVFTTAATPAYACSTVDTPLVGVGGELGQVQPDQGNKHVQTGEKVTYPVCPPASGKHINDVGFGPLEPKVYGPDDQSLPTGWIHNLEHGGLVLLYACDKGACDPVGIQALRDTAAGFPASAVCGLPAGAVGPVVARFEQMPTRYAALIWNRALYLDTLDPAKIYDFYTRYGERISDGKWVAPPEPQCRVPSASPSAGPSAEPSPSGT